MVGQVADFLDTFVVDKLFGSKSAKFFMDDLNKVSGTFGENSRHALRKINGLDRVISNAKAWPSKFNDAARFPHPIGDALAYSVREGRCVLVRNQD